MALRIFWTPAGINIDSLRNNKRLVDISDGDTPNIRMSVRMLSIDTPEKRSTAGISMSKIDDMFAAVGDWIQSGNAPMGDALAAHLQATRLVPEAKRRVFRQLSLAKELSKRKSPGRTSVIRKKRFWQNRLNRPKTAGRLNTLFKRSSVRLLNQLGSAF